MWIGVTRGLAGLKFSGSPNARGAVRIMVIVSIITRIIPRMSLDEKNGWKLTLSMFLGIPSVWDDPVWCRNIR